MTRARIALFVLAAAGLATPALAQAGFDQLFDGRSLAGWTTVGPQAWSVAGGAASADAGATSFLLSDRSYGDFELRVEFWVSDDANSGVFIRCASRTEITASSCYEVNIFEQRPDQSYATGGIVDVAKVAQVPRTGGQWNTMVIVARGDTLTVSVNGRTTVDAIRNAAHREGPFALQHSAGTVRFRKVGIRPL